MNVKHLGNTGSRIVLIPQPTSDPDDPLNWSRARKEYHFWLLWMWGFLAAVSVNWAGPVWTQLTTDFSTTYSELNVSVALCYVFLGLGCIILQSLAVKIGRRPVYLLGTIFNIGGCVLGGVATTVQMYFGVQILTGFGAAPVDSLVEISTMDLYFAHERGTRLSLYIFAIYAGSYLGPVASGYIGESQSWRWCFWYLTIFFTVLLVIQLFTMEESSFSRTLIVQGINPVLSVDTDAPQDDHDSKAAIDSVKPQASPSPTSIPHSDESQLATGKTYWQRMRLITRSTDSASWWLIMLRPFTLVTYPAIVWAGIVYGVQITWLTLLLTTQSEIFAAAPYNFSVSAVGLTNFSAFIGGIFGMLWGGLVSDKCLLFLAKKNNGIAEPEMRLWTMALPGIINTAGIIMYGVGAYNQVSWVLPAGFGIAFIAFGIGSGGPIAITYAVDCYPDIAAEALMLMLFVRNMIGAGLTFAIQPWLDADGLKSTSITMAVLCFVVNFSFVLMTCWGKTMRRWTAA